MIKTLAIIIVPLITALCGLAMLRHNGLYDDFVQGIRDGISSAVSLLPGLIALMTAVGMFNASGAADALAGLCEPILSKAGIPAELVPMLILRPVSGSASGALFDSLLAEHGPDSYIGRCASVIAGSSDTVLYIMAVYFGAAGVRKSGPAAVAALVSAAFCAVMACICVRMML